MRRILAAVAASLVASSASAMEPMLVMRGDGCPDPYAPLVGITPEGVDLDNGYGCRVSGEWHQQAPNHWQADLADCFAHGDNLPDTTADVWSNSDGTWTVHVEGMNSPERLWPAPQLPR